MATAAMLPSHNCLTGSIGHGNLSSSPPKSGRSGRNRSGRRKRSSPASDKQGRRTGGPVVVRFPAKGLVMEQVKILKRGEELKFPRTAVVGSANDGGDELLLLKVVQTEDLGLFSTERLGPEPKMVSKQIRPREVSGFDGVYAGCSWLASPSPNCVPRPAFLTKNLQKCG